MAATQETPITRRRSSRPVRNSDVKPSSATRRSRGVRQPTQSVLADLDQMITALIKENRELQRQIDKLSRQALGATSGLPSAPCAPFSPESAAPWRAGQRRVAGDRSPRR
jgi:hypothetical protein